MDEFAPGIWLQDGEAVNWYGMPYTTRMTIVPLRDNELWIHSPCKLTPDLSRVIQRLGQPRWLIAPNKLHHLYLDQWQSAFPDAELFAAPGLAQKRKDLTFTAQLGSKPESAWSSELDQLIFRGSPVMQEVVFFHRRSATVIVTDLVENFSPDHFRGWRNTVAKLSGIVSPNGKTPIDWRLTFAFHKKAARQSLEQMLDWRPENLVLAHGECVKGEATDFLKRSFSWI